MFSAAHFLDIFKRKLQLGLFDRVRERERLLNEHDGDPYATIAQLLKSMAELKRENQELWEDKQELTEKEEFALRWKKTYHPESWDDVDDTWIRMWTPFRNKASAETFVVPRLPYFESWHNFSSHQVDKDDFSAIMTEEVEAMNRATPGKIDELTDRFSRQTKIKKPIKRKK